MTGYVVTGADPRVSDSFTVVSVYLSDPLRRNRVVNRRVSWASLRSGALKYRFQAYRDTNSPYDDPLKDGTLAGAVRPAPGPSEWYRRWVLILPFAADSPRRSPRPSRRPSRRRSRRRADASTPTPEPTPEPTPRPRRSRRPEPTLAATPEPTPEPTPATPEPTPEPAP